MPANDSVSGTVYIPAIGLTFTPVVQPEPIVPTSKSQTQYSLGAKVLPRIWIGNTTAGMSLMTIVSVDDKMRLLSSDTHRVYNDTNTQCYSADDVEVVNGCWKLKTIPAAPAPLVSYDELKCGEVAVINRNGWQSDVYIYKGHFDNECMWWYGTVNMAVRTMDRSKDYDGGFGFSGGAKVLRVVGTLRNNINR